MKEHSIAKDGTELPPSEDIGKDDAALRSGEKDQFGMDEPKELYDPLKTTNATGRKKQGTKLSDAKNDAKESVGGEGETDDAQGGATGAGDTDPAGATNDNAAPKTGVGVPPAPSGEAETDDTEGEVGAEDTDTDDTSGDQSDKQNGQDDQQGAPTQAGAQGGAQSAQSGAQGGAQSNVQTDATQTPRLLPGQRVVDGKVVDMLKASVDEKGRTHAMVFDTRVNKWRPAEDFQKDAWGKDTNGDMAYLEEHDLGIGYGTSAEENDMFDVTDPNHMDRRSEAVLRGMGSFMSTLPDTVKRLINPIFSVTQAVIAGKPMAVAERAIGGGMAAMQSINDGVRNAAHEYNIRDPYDARLKNTLYGAKREAETEAFNQATEAISKDLQDNFGGDMKNASLEQLQQHSDRVDAYIAEEKAKHVTSNSPSDIFIQDAKVRQLENYSKGLKNSIKAQRSASQEGDKRAQEDKRRRFDSAMEQLGGVSGNIADAYKRTFGNNKNIADRMDYMSVNVNGKDITVPVMNTESEQKRLYNEMTKKQREGVSDPAFDSYLDVVRESLNDWNATRRSIKAEQRNDLLKTQNPFVATIMTNGKGEIDLTKAPSVDPYHLHAKIEDAKLALSKLDGASPTYIEDRKALENGIGYLNMQRNLQLGGRISDQYKMTDEAIATRQSARNNVSADPDTLTAVADLTGDNTEAQEILDAFRSKDPAEVRKAASRMCDLVRANMGGSEVYAGDGGPLDANSETKGTSGTGITGKTKSAYDLVEKLMNVASDGGRFASDSDMDREMLQEAGHFENVTSSDMDDALRNDLNEDILYSRNPNPRLAKALVSVYSKRQRAALMEAQRLRQSGDAQGATMKEQEAKDWGNKELSQERLARCGGDIEVYRTHKRLANSMIKTALNWTPEEQKHTGVLLDVYWKQAGTGRAPNLRDWCVINTNSMDINAWGLNKDEIKLIQDGGDLSKGRWIVPKDPDMAHKLLKATLTRMYRDNSIHKSYIESVDIDDANNTNEEISAKNEAEKTQNTKIPQKSPVKPPAEPEYTVMEDEEGNEVFDTPQKTVENKAQNPQKTEYTVMEDEDGNEIVPEDEEEDVESAPIVDETTGVEPPTESEDAFEDDDVEERELEDAFEDLEVENEEPEDESEDAEEENEEPERETKEPELDLERDQSGVKWGADNMGQRMTPHDYVEAVATRKVEGKTLDYGNLSKYEKTDDKGKRADSTFDERNPNPGYVVRGKDGLHIISGRQYYVMGVDSSDKYAALEVFKKGGSLALDDSGMPLNPSVLFQNSSAIVDGRKVGVDRNINREMCKYILKDMFGEGNYGDMSEFSEWDPHRSLKNIMKYSTFNKKGVKRTPISDAKLLMSSLSRYITLSQEAKQNGKPDAYNSLPKALRYALEHPQDDDTPSATPSTPNNSQNPVKGASANEKYPDVKMMDPKTGKMTTGRYDAKKKTYVMVKEEDPQPIKVWDEDAGKAVTYVWSESDGVFIPEGSKKTRATPKVKQEGRGSGRAKTPAEEPEQEQEQSEIPKAKKVTPFNQDAMNRSKEDQNKKEKIATIQNKVISMLVRDNIIPEDDEAIRSAEKACDKLLHANPVYLKDEKITRNSQIYDDIKKQLKKDQDEPENGEW